MENSLEQFDISENVVYSIAVADSISMGQTKYQCFAATSNGLITSKDGTVWENAYSSLNISVPLTTTSVVVSPEFFNDHIIISGVSGGILRSEDEGGTWQTVLFPQPLPVISCLALSPNFSADGIVFAGTMEDGVFFSSDEGAHWVSWNFGLLDLNVLCIAASPTFSEDETVFIGTESGIFKSTNGGRAWKEVVIQDNFVPTISLAISPNYGKDGMILAGTESNGLYQSLDRGKTWEQIGDSILHDPINTILFSPDFANDHKVILVAGGTIFYSDDMGKSWIQDQSLPPSLEITTAYLTKSKMLWYGTVGARVYNKHIN